MHLTSGAALLRPALGRNPVCARCRRFIATTPRCASDRSQWQGGPSKRADTRNNEPWTRSVPKQPLTSQPPPQSSSLFCNLFPDLDAATPAGKNDQALDQAESQQRPRTRAASHGRRGTEGTAGVAAASRRDELWRESSISTRDLRSWLETQASAEEVLPDKDQMPAMLVLAHASRSLTESDFHRIGPQGEHLQGWNGPIKQIVQAYDRNTLEPLGYYFILFASKAAARAYQTEAERTHWPLKPTGTISLPSNTPKSKSSSSPVFTLSSSSTAPLGLKVHSLPPSTAARLRPFTMDGILATAAPPTSGDFDKAPSPRPQADHHVILSLNSGAIDLSTLQGFLQRDGEHRNLAWDITHVYPYFPQKLRGVERRAVSRRGSRTQHGTKTAQNEQAVESEDAAGREAQGDSPVSDSAKSGRFVLSFGDVHEARRFVRTWHRREFEVLTPPEDAEETNGRDIRRSITVNAVMPW